MTHRPRWRNAALGISILVLAGCVGLIADEPWTAPIESAGSTTEWTDRGPMGIGPGGIGAESPQELLDEVEEIALGIVPAGEHEVERRLLIDQDPPRAWVRVTLLGAQSEVRAYETIVEVRETDNHRWLIRQMEERYHCVAPVATDFCLPES